MMTTLVRAALTVCLLGLTSCGGSEEYGAQASGDPALAAIHRPGVAEALRGADVPELAAEPIVAQELPSPSRCAQAHVHQTAGATFAEHCF